MTTETVTENNVIDIPAMVKERDSFAEQYQAKLLELGAAGAANDLQAMMRLGAELTDIAGKRDRLTRKIERASGASSPDSEAKRAAQVVAFNALRDFMGTPNAEPLRAFKVANPALKSIHIDFNEDGTIGFDSVGGIRVVTVTGTKRPRAVWTGGSLREKEMSSKEVIINFQKKYKNETAYAQMSVSDRQSLLKAITEGEKLVNKTKAETPAA